MSNIRLPVVAHGFSEITLTHVEAQLRDAFIANCYPAQNGYANIARQLQMDALVIRDWFADQRKLCSQMIKNGQRAQLPECVASKIRMNVTADALLPSHVDHDMEQRLIKVWERHPFPTEDRILDWAAFVDRPVEQVKLWLEQKNRDFEAGRDAGSHSTGGPSRASQRIVDSTSLPTPTATVSPQTFATPTPLPDDYPVKLESSRVSPFAAIANSPRISYRPSLSAGTVGTSPVAKSSPSYPNTRLFNPHEALPENGTPGPGPTTLRHRDVSFELFHDRSLSHMSTGADDLRVGIPYNPQADHIPPTPTSISSMDVKPSAQATYNPGSISLRHGNATRPNIFESELFAQFAQYWKETSSDWKKPTTLEEVLQMSQELGERSQKVLDAWENGHLRGIGLPPPNEYSDGG